MVTSLEEIYRLIGDSVDQSMFLGDTPRPAAGECELQGFWLSQSFEWISHDALHQIKDPHGNASLRLDPIAEVL